MFLTPSTLVRTTFTYTYVGMYAVVLQVSGESRAIDLEKEPLTWTKRSFVFLMWGALFKSLDKSWFLVEVIEQKVKRLLDCRIYDKDFQYFDLWPFIREWNNSFCWNVRNLYHKFSRLPTFSLFVLFIVPMQHPIFISLSGAHRTLEKSFVTRDTVTPVILQKLNWVWLLLGLVTLIVATMHIVELSGLHHTNNSGLICFSYMFVEELDNGIFTQQPLETLLINADGKQLMVQYIPCTIFCCNYHCYIMIVIFSFTVVIISINFIIIIIINLIVIIFTITLITTIFIIYYLSLSSFFLLSWSLPSRTL